MSGFGRAVPRAWKRGTVRSQQVTRDVEIDLEAEAKHWIATAPKLGFCGGCGVTVDETNGKLHGSDCPYLPEERRRATCTGER